MDAEKPPNILFIDDDRNVLSGLKRSLRHLRHKWNMDFLLGGAEALQHAEKKHCHVLVTDLCMPQMSGLELLKKFKNAHPDTVRIVLSGQTDRDAFWEAIGVAHLYMGKPCDSRSMESVIDRALSTQTKLLDSGWRRIISQTEFVPFFPQHWKALQNQLNQKQPNLQAIAGTIQQDPGMSAKILQIANSAYFGTSHFFTNAQKAAVSMSTEGINALATCYQSLLDTEKIDAPPDLMDWIKKRSRLTATIARRIAQADAPEEQDQVFLVGLLQALGEIVFVNHEPETYRRALTRSRRENRLLWDTEQEMLHCSHADLSLFLASLWGLPEKICAALVPPSRSALSESPVLAAPGISFAAELLSQELMLLQTDQATSFLTDDDPVPEKLAIYLPKWREIGRAVFQEYES